MMYEKECPICGVFFNTPTKIRKYCDKCAKNATRKAKKAEWEVIRSKKENPTVRLISYVCELCGKEHTVETKYLTKLKICGSSRSSWDEEDHYYCCEQHADQARHDHATCSNCGKILKGTSYSYSPYREHNYCSAECEYIHKDAMATYKGWKHQCQNCGKEFIRKVGKGKAYFCSKECTLEAKKKGWISPEAKDRQSERLLNQVQIKYTCSQCGREYIQAYKDTVQAFLDKDEHHFCTKDCRKKYFDEMRREAKRQTREEREAAAAKAAERAPDEPLCATCRTPYKQCERMKSDFRILPEGAHYDNKGILVECPKYTGRKEKKNVDC